MVDSYITFYVAVAEEGLLVVAHHWLCMASLWGALLRFKGYWGNIDWLSCVVYWVNSALQMGKKGGPPFWFLCWQLQEHFFETFIQLAAFHHEVLHSCGQRPLGGNLYNENPL